MAIPNYSVLLLTGICTTLLFTPLAVGQDFEDFERNITEFTLDNGMRFIVYERHDAPVVSFHTHANVGSVDEYKGVTGMAHMFEHMAFKGSRSIGSKNIEKELELMDEMDELFVRIKKAKREGDQETLQKSMARFMALQEEVNQYRELDEYDLILDREGAEGMNATTGHDSTNYFYSLPANKLELWMLMESERFYQPVLREFYKEKQVVMEERRMRTESNPVGKLIEDFLATAYKAHPYGEPPIGHRSDIETYTRDEAKAWFDKYYGPENLTSAIVGDVDPDEVKELANKYFGRLQQGEKPGPVETKEPEQNGPRTCTVLTAAQPLVLIGYHKPSINHPDNAVFDAITDILGAGRTSRLYRSLVRDKKCSAGAGAFAGLVGDKYPGLFIFYSFAAQGRDNETNETAIEEEIETLKSELVSEEDLEKAKTRARASLIRQLDSNSGLASQLTFYQVITGDWRNLFKQLDQIDAVTAEDIKRVANTYFNESNKTTGYIVTQAPDQSR